MSEPTSKPMTGLYIPNGGRSADTFFCTDGKVRYGWSWECGTHAAFLFPTPPDMFLWHLPWGCSDPARMRFDEVCYARLNPHLVNVCDTPSFVASMLTIHHAAPSVEHGFYLGSPEFSSIMSADWNTARFESVDARTATVLEPIGLLRDRLVRVRMWIDSSCIRSNDSLTAHVAYLSERRWRIPIGAESRLRKESAWLNRPDVPVVCHRQDWYNQESDPATIPAKELQGPQWIICQSEEECRAELDQGRSVLYTGSITTGHERSSPGTASSRSGSSPSVT